MIERDTVYAEWQALAARLRRYWTTELGTWAEYDRLTEQCYRLKVRYQELGRQMESVALAQTQSE